RRAPDEAVEAERLDGGPRPAPGGDRALVGTGARAGARLERRAAERERALVRDRLDEAELARPEDPHLEAVVEVERSASLVACRAHGRGEDAPQALADHGRAALARTHVGRDDGLARLRGALRDALREA